MFAGQNKYLSMSYFNNKTTKDILDKLESKLWRKSDFHVNTFSKKFARPKCEEGVDVRQHVNEMIAPSDELVYH